MKNYKYVKLSSGMTNITFVGLIILAFILLAVIFSQFIFTLFDVNIWGFILVSLILLALVFFMLINLTKAEIIENQFHLKKFFGQKEIFDIQQLESVKSMDSRKETFILFTIKDHDKKKNYLIYGSKLFYAKDNSDSETILKDILLENKKKY